MNYNTVITPYREAPDSYDGLPVILPATLAVDETGRNTACFRRLGRTLGRF